MPIRDFMEEHFLAAIQLHVLVTLALAATKITFSYLTRQMKTRRIKKLRTVQKDEMKFLVTSNSADMTATTKNTK